MWGHNKQAVQKEVRELAVFLGEAPESDPAAIFGLVWAFAQAFDAAYLAVAKRQQAEAAEVAKKAQGPKGGALKELSQAVKKSPSGRDRAEAALPAKPGDPVQPRRRESDGGIPAKDSALVVGAASSAEGGLHGLAKEKPVPGDKVGGAAGLREAGPVANGGQSPAASAPIPPDIKTASGGTDVVQPAVVKAAPLRV